MDNSNHKVLFYDYHADILTWGDDPDNWVRLPQVIGHIVADNIDHVLRIYCVGKTYIVRHLGNKNMMYIEELESSPQDEVIIYEQKPNPHVATK